jgi:mercuric ion transport protein
MDKEKWALGGSVLSAVAASLCCLGPLVAVLVGASGFAAAGFFAPWRPLLLTITALMLTMAWYLTYRRPKAGRCSRAAGCLPTPVAKGNKIILWLATAFVIAVAALPTFSGAAARWLLPAGASERGPSQVKLATLRVSIPSMDCGACAAGIQAKLNQQDGVQAAQVDFATKTAVIRFDPGKLSTQQVTALIDQTGFKAESATFPRK